MKNKLKPLLALFALLLNITAGAQILSQGEAVPKGAIVYSLLPHLLKLRQRLFVKHLWPARMQNTLRNTLGFR